MAMRAKTQVGNRYSVNNRTVLFSRQTSSKRFSQNIRPVDFTFIWSGFLPMRLLKHFADKVAGTLCFGMASARARPSRNDSSRRSMPYVIPGDSHREEAIADCIEFINSSYYFSRATTPIASQVSSSIS